MRWTTRRQYIDKDTGEVLKADQIQKGKYIILKSTTKHIKDNEYFGTKHITHICGRNEQTQIW